MDWQAEMQSLKFECGATNPVAVEECLHKHVPAKGIWGHAPKMTLNVPRLYNPVWEQDHTEAAHSLGMIVRHSSSRAIVHNAVK